jgi:hypothetical protein
LEVSRVTSRNILVVVLDPVPGEQIRRAVQMRRESADVTVHVVAPAVSAGVLQWLTGADDDARAEAANLADETADAIDAEVETEVGDRDPVVAVEDALTMFPADEILLAGEADSEMEAALRRLGLPISRLGGTRAHGTADTAAGAAVREVARGKSPTTPFVLLGAVGGVILAVIAFVSVITLIIVWLA